MATRVNGSVGTNSSHYKYYFTYSTTFDSTTMKWTVKVDTYLYIYNGSWQYNFKAGYNTAIGGATKVSKSGVSYSGSITASGTKTIHISTATQTYKASSSSRSVEISTTFKVSSGTKGPGSCKAATKISLAAKISTVGNLVVNYTSGKTAYINIAAFAQTDYTRTVKLYKKTVNQNTWTLIKTYSLAGSTKGAGIYTDTNVSTEVNSMYKIEVFAPTNILTFTRNVTLNVIPEGMILSVPARYMEEIDIKISNVTVDSNHRRWVAIFYRESGITPWIKYQNQNIELSPELGSWTFNITDLEPAKSYDIVVRLLKANSNIDDNLLELKSTECITVVDDYDLVMEPQIQFLKGSDGKLYVGFNDSSEYDYKVQGYYRSSEFGKKYDYQPAFQKLFDVKEFELKGFISIGEFDNYAGRYRFKFIIERVDNSKVKVRTVGVDFNVFIPTEQSMELKEGYDDIYTCDNWYDTQLGVETDYVN